MNVVLSHWSVPMGVVIPLVVSIVLYERGMRRINSGAETPGALQRRKERIQQRRLFLAGNAMVVLALCSPLDYWSDQYFWVHMSQHMVLWFAAPPLLILGAPWLPMLRGLPSGIRQPWLRWLYRSRPGAVLRRVIRFGGHPAIATSAFVGDIYLWHVPVVFNATITNPFVHDFEHVTFLLTGMWLWGQLLGSRPYEPRLGYFSRIWVISGVLFPNWFLAIGMAYSNKPWYSAYHSVAGRAMGVLSDQQLAAAIMWVIPMIPLGVAAFWTLNKWLDKDADEDEQLAELLVRARLEARPAVSGPSLTADGGH